MCLQASIRQLLVQSYCTREGKMSPESDQVRHHCPLTDCQARRCGEPSVAMDSTQDGGTGGVELPLACTVDVSTGRVRPGRAAAGKPDGGVQRGRQPGERGPAVAAAPAEPALQAGRRHRRRAETGAGADGRRSGDPSRIRAPACSAVPGGSGHPSDGSTHAAGKRWLLQAAWHMLWVEARSHVRPASRSVHQSGAA